MYNSGGTTSLGITVTNSRRRWINGATVDIDGLTAVAIALAVGCEDGDYDNGDG